MINIISIYYITTTFFKKIHVKILINNTILNKLKLNNNIINYIIIYIL